MGSPPSRRSRRESGAARRTSASNCTMSSAAVRPASRGLASRANVSRASSPLTSTISRPMRAPSARSSETRSKRCASSGRGPKRSRNSDQHTVKPWFNGKLDFSPPVYDFAGRGFPLIGGRLDYVGGRAVAALVFGRRQHVINVFLWPTRGSVGGAPRVATRQGYHMLQWTTPAYAYWVVSDLGLAELHDFAQLLRQGDSTAAGPAAAPPPP